jgi:hypothetical protein
MFFELLNEERKKRSRLLPLLKFCKLIQISSCVRWNKSLFLELTSCTDDSGTESLKAWNEDKSCLCY